jgi:hypothetical protein
VSIFELRHGRLTRHGERDADNDDDNNKIIKPGDVWKRRTGPGGGVAVIHQFGFGTFNVAVSRETLAMLHTVRPRGERTILCSRGGIRALLNAWHGPKGN